MARRKDSDWNVGDGNNVSFDGAQLAVMMDIRDELKILNRIIGCPNFQNIPTKLDRIRDYIYQVRRNTNRIPTKKRKIKK